MRRKMAIACLLLLLLQGSLFFAKVQPLRRLDAKVSLSLQSPYALCRDLGRKRELYARQAKQKIPAPLLARLLLLLQGMEELPLDAQLPISKAAAAADLPPSGFPSLLAGESERVEYLLLRLYHDGSDGVALALAEGLSGSVMGAIKDSNRQLRHLDLRQSQVQMLTGQLRRSDGQAFDAAAFSPKDARTLSTQHSSLMDQASLLHRLWQSPHYARLFSHPARHYSDPKHGLVRFQSPWPRLWSASRSRISFVLHEQAHGMHSSLVISEPKEGARAFLLWSPQTLDSSHELYRFSEAMDQAYEETVLIKKGERWPGAKTVLQDGQVLELIALESLRYLHPVGDPFLGDAVQVQAHPSFAPPIAYASPITQLSVLLADGHRLSLPLGAARRVDVTSYAHRMLWEAQQAHPELLWLAFFLILCLWLGAFWRLFLQLRQHRALRRLLRQIPPRVHTEDLL